MFLQFFIVGLTNELIWRQFFDVLSSEYPVYEEHKVHVPVEVHERQLRSGHGMHVFVVELK